jgi:hypothetical protein
MYQYQEIDFKILDIWRSFFFIIKNYFLIYKKMGRNSKMALLPSHCNI